jgi:DNA-binding XRE family transcriptional regulator
MALTKRPVASPAQCRAARALLRWTQGMLAQHATVARKTVADFELGNRSLHRRTRLDITVALEAAGIEFIWGSEGEGVRFARKATLAAQAPMQPATQLTPPPAAETALRRAVTT